LTGLTGGLASAPSSNDIIVVSSGSYFGSTTATYVPSITDGATAYTSLAAVTGISSSGFQSSIRVAYKISTGSDTTVYMGDTGGSDPRAVSVHVWRFENTTTPIDVTTQTATYGSGATSTVPNPPAITPVTYKAIIIATAGSVESSMGAPSNMTNYVESALPSPPTAFSNGMASALWTGGSFDPATFGTSGGSRAWAAATLVLRPR
jgi:hypothetical protein